MSTTQGIIFGVAAAALAGTISGAAIGAVPPEQLNRVVDLGLNHSEIGDTIEHLTDQIGRPSDEFAGAARCGGFRHAESEGLAAQQCP